MRVLSLFRLSKMLCSFKIQVCPPWLFKGREAYCIFGVDFHTFTWILYFRIHKWLRFFCLEIYRHFLWDASVYNLEITIRHSQIEDRAAQQKKVSCQWMKCPSTHLRCWRVCHFPWKLDAWCPNDNRWHSIFEVTNKSFQTKRRLCIAKTEINNRTSSMKGFKLICNHDILTHIGTFTGIVRVSCVA
jgi:hypothetical protein